MQIDTIRKFYNNYFEKLIVENKRHKKVFESIDRFIPKGTTVLDIGCGAGFTSKHLAEGNRKVVAVELSPVLLEWARKHNNHDNILYVEDDICELKTSDKFDAIVMVDILEHILPENRNRLFDVLRNVSHDNTYIYLNIPSPNVTQFLRQYKHDLLQIVDEPVEVSEIISLFGGIGFVPYYFQLYWMQYIEYVFVSEYRFNKALLIGYNV